ncbi:hypothetical protein EVB55_254 [Rhizobium phage RHph_Y68]|uniref:Uncharacterized protein n=1 Tax=Rhizobium phage RHph_Y68 TaxID=2509787 RepID=A0A7S5R9V4_9CAUD|nr:hypothetical protein PP934_gp254 [Rhizobium phage RHph_Y68]QIG68189.1 hypothetical protein EVB55_254 [Rhizobium phage RHph_Y68]
MRIALFDKDLKFVDEKNFLETPQHGHTVILHSGDDFSEKRHYTVTAVVHETYRHYCRPGEPNMKMYLIVSPVIPLDR